MTNYNLEEGPPCNKYGEEINPKAQMNHLKKMKKAYDKLMSEALELDNEIDEWNADMEDHIYNIQQLLFKLRGYLDSLENEIRGNTNEVS